MTERTRKNQRRPYDRPEQPAKAIIKSRRFRIREVADEAGCSHALVNDSLSGRYRPSPKVVQACVRMLNLPAADLFHAEDLGR
ncbi:MAG TPA: helix-turn-helix transcriptional regulator [Acidimicrobiales bacterium]|jgi:transcriptional regulator with XRE-family HTH domain|nr:helix-turn-helix transcriptional regulator [Acidimicrobiales bacterium]